MQIRQAMVLGALLGATLIGCGAPGPPLPPSLDLPEPVKDLRATRKGDEVHLAWTIPRQNTDGVNNRHLGATRVCRAEEPGMTECTTPVGEVPTAQLVAQFEAEEEKKNQASQSSSQKQKQERRNKNVERPQPVTATAITKIPAELQTDLPSETVTYAVETLNGRGRSAGLSNQVDVPLIKTLPPPNRIEARVTADGVALSWGAVTLPGTHAGVSYLYRMYRREKGTAANVTVGQRPADQEPSLLDSTADWGKTYLYHLTTVTVVAQSGSGTAEIEGEDSPNQQVTTNDVFPPATPVGLQAVFSSVGQKPFIDLTWAPNTDSDLAGYNIYRQEARQEWIRMNVQPVQIPSFRDGNVASGRSYAYAITAVDLRGNESERSEQASEKVP
jgi:fibronectin type 3 domain-containing protein